MLRRTVLVLAATVVLMVAAPAVPARAGGCSAEVTTGQGDTVEMRNACFTPTSLRIAPGASVTFVNRDGFTHNVGGARWGNFDDMERGDAFTATFEEPGVYPYACTYHPGMTGAIVVGDGTGAGNGDEVHVVPLVADPPQQPQALAATSAPVADDTSPVGWVAAGVAGLAIGLAVGRFGRRRSETPPAG